jgi:type II secretory pathway component GspD/PulD (secretin)
MQRFIGGLVLTLALWANLGLSAEEAPLQAGRCISVEVVLVEVMGPKPAAVFEPMLAAEAVAGRLQELEQQGRVGSLVRLRLATLENCPAKVQFGESIPVASGRTMMPRGRDGGQPPMAVNYSMVQVGTLANVTARFEKAETIVADIEIERSHLARKSDAAGTGNQESLDAPPQGVATVTAKSTARIPAGKAVSIATEESAPGESRQTWILVTAKLLDEP